MQKLIGFLLFLGCAHQHHHPHGENRSNQHMHRSSHQELIASFDDPRRDQWQKPELVISRLRPLKGKRMMDIGAGSGYFTKYFLQEGALVVAADVDQKFLEHLQKSFSAPDLSLRKIKFDDPLMQQNEFDLAFTSNTYHHIDGRGDYLKKVLRGLKPLGKFVVLDFKTDAKDSFGPPQKMRIPLKQVKKELNEAGFSRLEVYEDFENHYLVIAHK